MNLFCANDIKDDKLILINWHNFIGRNKQNR